MYNKDFFTRFPLGLDDMGERYRRDEGEIILYDVPDFYYHFNSFRYRGHIEPDDGVPAAFGDSFTFGLGVSEGQHWPGLLGAFNGGQCSASNDKIARLAVSYCEEYKPEVIYISWSFPARREWITEEGEIIAWKARGIPKEDWEEAFLNLSNDNWDLYNYTKNKMFVKNYCKVNNIKLSMIDNTNPFSHEDLPKARDGDHPGVEWHVIVAEHFKNQ